MKTLTLDQLLEEHEKDLEALHRGMAAESAERIVDNAPEDSGRLKGSVNISRNSTKFVDDNADPGGSRTKSSNRSEALQGSINDDFFVTIGEDYAIFVDRGTSDTPPTGFASSVLDNLDVVLRQVKIDLRKYRDD